MVEKESDKSEGENVERSEHVYRQKLAEELEVRLQAVWSKLGHLIDWCDDAASWTQGFCSEARPFRETFYWEAVAEMVGDYLRDHPQDSGERALTDCLIATQCSPRSGDSERLTYFWDAWGEILACSQKEIEAFIEADLDLAMDDGHYEYVARLYAAEYQRCKDGEKPSK